MTLDASGVGLGLETRNKTVTTQRGCQRFPRKEPLTHSDLRGVGKEKALQQCSWQPRPLAPAHFTHCWGKERARFPQDTPPPLQGLDAEYPVCNQPPVGLGMNCKQKNPKVPFCEQKNPTHKIIKKLSSANVLIYYILTYTPKAHVEMLPLNRDTHCKSTRVPIQTKRRLRLPCPAKTHTKATQRPSPCAS